MARRSGVDVEIVFDRIQEINDRIPSAVSAIIRKAVHDTEAHAKLAVPVRTGALKNSLASHIEERGDVVVGEVYTNLHYAPYIEFGTRYMAAKPYLTPAFDRVRVGVVGLLSKLEPALGGP